MLVMIIIFVVMILMLFVMSLMRAATFVDVYRNGEDSRENL